MEMLDFNALDKPTWPVKLKDDAHTVVHLTYPTLELVERMEALGRDLGGVIAKKDGATIGETFKVVAMCMSCNDDGYTFTGEELRDKYKFTMLDLARFVSGYLRFLQEAATAKN